MKTVGPCSGRPRSQTKRTPGVSLCDLPLQVLSAILSLCSQDQPAVRTVSRYLKQAFDSGVRSIHKSGIESTAQALQSRSPSSLQQQFPCLRKVNLAALGKRWTL